MKERKNEGKKNNHRYQCKVVLSSENTDTESLGKAGSLLNTIRFKKVEP